MADLTFGVSNPEGSNMESSVHEAMARVRRDFRVDAPTEDALLRSAVRTGNYSRVALRYLSWHGFSDDAAICPHPGQWLHDVAARVGKSIRNAAARVQERFPGDKAVFSAEKIKAEVGGLGCNHGLRPREAGYLPDLHEDQLTRALANALHANGCPEKWHRIRTFLVSLGVRQGLLDSLDQVQVPRRIAARAESNAGGRRRTDLQITWPIGERVGDGEWLEGGVVIEAKFDANLQDNQLEAYSSWAKEHLSCEYRELVFLTPAGIEPPPPDQGKKPKEPLKWRAVSWKRLLRCWEALLEDSEPDLGMVKHLIWRKVG